MVGGFCLCVCLRGWQEVKEYKVRKYSSILLMMFDSV